MMNATAPTISSRTPQPIRLTWNRISSSAPEHQRRQNAEQITVLHRLGEHREQLCRLRNAGRMAPVAGHHGGGQQKPEPAERRPQRCENQIPFHGPPRGELRQLSALTPGPLRTHRRWLPTSGMAWQRGKYDRFQVCQSKSARPEKAKRASSLAKPALRKSARLKAFD